MDRKHSLIDVMIRPWAVLPPVLILGAVLATSGVASAHYGPCNNDPAVWLSNGAKIHMYSVIQGNLKYVSNVAFTVHVPSGVGVNRIQYTGGRHAPETVNVVADSPSGYTVDEYATSKFTYNLTLSVHATEHGHASQWAQTTGTTNENVQVSVS